MNVKIARITALYRSTLHHSLLTQDVSIQGVRGIEMIDWDRMNSLRDDVGADEFDEVVELFFEEIDDIIDRLRTSPDPSTLGEDLHALKGCAQGMGFRAFARLCQAGETQCSAGTPEDVDLQGILQVYASSKRIFLEELPSALAG